MFSYIVRRLAFGALTIFGVSIVVFLVMRILPGDPLVAIFGPDGFTKLTEAQRAHLMAELGLSDPLLIQYLDWMKDILAGNFGRSFFRSESVADMILRRGPLTAEIAALSVALSWLVGIPIAIVSALKPNSIWDNVARFFGILFIAIPGFWLGMLMVLALLFWFGYRAPLTGGSLWSDPWTNLQMVIGPSIVLGLGQAAYIARMARSSLLEVIREDYVRTARAKGFSSRLVIVLHALPNALLPVITLSGILLGFVLAGSIPVERAFGTPGLGNTMFNAVKERDVFVMQNLVFLFSVVFVMLNIWSISSSPGSTRGSATNDRHRSESRVAHIRRPGRARAPSRLRRLSENLSYFVRRSPLAAFWGVIASLVLAMAITAPCWRPIRPSNPTSGA